MLSCLTSGLPLSIIAIHGLSAQSPSTWEFRKSDGSGVVNWLVEEDMLPAAVPEARILTYDWNGNYFGDAAVQTLLGHADSLLGLVAEDIASTSDRPLVFIASCFGGLVLSEALNRASQPGSLYAGILLRTVGVVFLGTPFCGTDASRNVQWIVVIKGIMGDQTSNSLVQELSRSYDLLRKRTQEFAEMANSSPFRLPICCFYETRPTEILRRILPVNRLTQHFVRRTRKIVCTGLPTL